MTLIAAGTLEGFAGTPREEIFAIGDVHGMADLLDEVLERISRTPAGELPRRVVLLGDLIDRGPESLRCLELARGAGERLGCPVTPLMGNHEQMLAAAVCGDGIPERDRAWVMDLWSDNGGREVISELQARGGEVGRRDPDSLREALGPETVGFLTGLHSHYAAPEGDVLFVHAGVAPHVPLDEFLASDWRDIASSRFREERSWCWIREPFLEARPRDTGVHGHHGMFVVHGHTPYDGVRLGIADMVGRDRINLDGYAFSTGLLRYARLSGNAYEVFEAGF